MSIKQKTVTVLGQDYMLTQFPAIRGTKVLKQLTKLIGPSFAAMQGSANEADKMKLALDTLFDNLDGPVEDLLVVLVQSATKGNVAINFDMEFAGEYDRLFLLVKEIVEFNFGTVFTMFGSTGV